MLRSIILASSLLLACGGSKPVPTSIEGGSPPATTTPTAASSDVAPEASRLAIGPLKIVMTDGAKRMELALAADGTVSVEGGERKRDLRVTAYGELEADGKPVAKLGDDGTMTVLHESVEKVEGKVVKTESKWTTIGTLAADGTFTGAKDGKKIAIEHDGKVSGLPSKMDFVIDGAPAHRRAGMFVVIGILSGGRTESDVKASPNNQVVPVPPMQP